MMQNNENKANNFSKNLKFLIKKNNIKNIVLADAIGVKKGAISNYLKGSMPYTKTIIKIAEYFDVSLDYLLGAEMDSANIKLNEHGKLVYSLPLFQKKLINTEIIYRNDNYVGEITSPIPIYEEQECYALLMYDDSMSSRGIAKGSLVIFSTTEDVASGDISAVLIKPKNTIVVSSVNIDSKTITLSNDNGSNVYRKTKEGCDVVVLGKILFATFAINNR